MEIKNWLMLTVLLVLVPGWIGSIWSGFAKIKNRTRELLFCWVTGFLTIMAVSQLILVPLILNRYRFHTYLRISGVCNILLIIVAAILNWRRFKKKEMSWKPAGKWNIWQGIFLAGACFLILIQAYVCSVYQHVDDDDSRFVVEQNLAVNDDCMFNEDLVTGDLVYWNVGEVRKDMISPWAMLLAFVAKISGIAPAILCHKYLPFFLILLCYGVYALIGMNLFKEDREKVGIFLIFVAALQLFGYFSTHTVPAMMLLRIWQGKAMVSSMVIPAVTWLLFEVMSEKKRIWYLLLAVGATAGALASGTGITVIPVLIGIFGLAAGIHERKVRSAISIWLTAIPSGVYLLCYLFFWQLLRVYY